MFRIDLGSEGDVHLRPAEVSSMQWQRGHSYANLVITMRGGEAFIVRDYCGSAYTVERDLLNAIEAAEHG